MLRRVVLIASGFLWSAVVPLGAASFPRPYTVENYDVNVRVDLAKQRLYGQATIRFHGRGDTVVSALELDAGGLRITSVAEGQAPQSFEQNRGMLFVVLARPVRPDEQRAITVQYEAGPAAGLKFFSDQIYASVTSDWLPCDDAPGERATLHLTLAAPTDMKVAASGQLTATRAGDGQSITEWQLDSPADPSRFGFALGTFAENTSDADGVKLRVLGAGTQILAPVAAAMHFLADRTGKPYRGPIYTQVFVHGDAIRSLAGLTLLPESYAQDVEKQQDHLRILANQLAQQWFGIAIATKDWSDLWLSKGISAYLADAFLGQRFGKAAYEREIEHSRQIYYRLVSEGKDQPLSSTAWTTRQQAEGGIPEYKGAWFLYLLDKLTGDDAFGNALKLYTSNAWEQAAASEDLQNAFDGVNAANPARKTNRNSLDSLFDMWVYGISDAAPPKRSREARFALIAVSPVLNAELTRRFGAVGRRAQEFSDR